MLLLHCGTMGREALIRRSEAALDTQTCRRDPGCLWLSLLTLFYADRGAQAAAFCDRLLAADHGDLPRRSTEAMILIRARIHSFNGRPAPAVDAVLPMLRGGISRPLSGIAVAWLLEALVQTGDLRAARHLSREHMDSIDALPDRAHVLAARAALRRAENDLERSLADYLAAGKILTALGVANPAVVPWRSRAALVATTLGRHDLANVLADDELALARRWGSPCAVGRALRAVGVSRQDDESTHALERAVELLDLTNARYELMGALCDLGKLCATTGDIVRARSSVAAATELARATGSAQVMRWADSVLGDLDNRTREARLTKQERKIADMALRGYSNKSIAETMFLTVRTVEFHLSNVYRKLGVSGRRQLPRVLSLRECA
ncbi:helix-turn-helix transcriptional regulator [Nocardia sp. NPDC003963]